MKIWMVILYYLEFVPFLHNMEGNKLFLPYIRKKNRFYRGLPLLASTEETIQPWNILVTAVERKQKGGR